MESLVVETISRLSDIKLSKISLTSSFVDLEIDSLDLAELVIELENELEIKIDNYIYQTKTVGELIEHIKKIK